MCVFKVVYEKHDKKVNFKTHHHGSKKKMSFCIVKGGQGEPPKCSRESTEPWTDVWMLRFSVIILKNNCDLKRFPSRISSQASQHGGSERAKVRRQER